MNTIRTMIPTAATTNTGVQSDQPTYSANDDDSDGMQSSQPESVDPSGPKVNENVVLLKSSSAGSISVGERASSEGYNADCSTSDQTSDQSFDHASCGQTQKSVMKLALNRVHLKYSSSSEMESGSPQSGSSLWDDASGPDSISSASKAKASNITAKRSLSSSLKANNNQEATMSKSAAVAPGLSSSNKLNHQDPFPNHHRRRSRPRPRAHDDSLDDLKDLLLDNSHKELANTSMFEGTQVLPQWKGVRVSHPMDPRIDISTVGHMQSGDTGGASNMFAATKSPSYDLPSMETYMQLLSVVRPFFQTHGIPHTQQQQQPEQQQQQLEVKNRSGTDGNPGTAASTNSINMDAENEEFQAPYVRQGAPPNSNKSVVNSNNGPPCMADAMASPVLLEHAPAGVIRPPARQQQQQQQEMSFSSSSSGGGRGQQLAQGHQPRNFSVSPRVVTDVSSSNRTDSAVSNPNTSGSGSAGNSGNDNKGSSEDRVKEDNSGEGTNEGSDEVGSEGQKKMALGIDNLVYRHDAILPEQPSQAASDDMSMKTTDGPTRERKLIDKKRKRIEMRREYEAQQQFESSASSESKGDRLLRPGKAVSMDEVLFLSKIPRIIIQAALPFLVVHTNAAYSRLTGMDSHTVVGKPISSLLSIMNQVGTSATAHSNDVQHEHSSIDDAAGNAQSSELGAAAEAGRARAEASEPDAIKIGLDRLVLSCGFGRLHRVQALTKTHQMVGRNVAIIKDATPLGGTALSTRNGGDAGSNGTSSANSFDRSTNQVLCQISIAPVVSASSPMDTSTVLDSMDSEMHKSKRRKHHGLEQEHHRLNDKGNEVYVHHRRHPHRQLVTHYVLQLEELDGKPSKNESLDSLSSNSVSVEARLVGLTRAELENQSLAANLPPAHEEPDIPDDVEDEGESIGPIKPVAAIG